MITPEKLIEMMNPAKAFEALTQGKAFDSAAQNKLLESSANEVLGLVEAYQAHTRKAVEFCLSQNEAAVKEGRKFVKNWVSAMTEANSAIVKGVQDNLQEAAKVFALPAPVKAAKAA